MFSLTVAFLIGFQVTISAQQAKESYTPYGIFMELPLFYNEAKADLKFPMAWGTSSIRDFTQWRQEARAKMMSLLLTPPQVTSYNTQVLESEKRNGYEVQKLAFNISSYCRIPAYLLIPDGKGPFPALVVLHDHGAHYSIGKEKVVEPFGVSREVYTDARNWVDKYYGGQWIADYFAGHGYVVLAIDALFWGERGRKEGVRHESQETLAVNLLQLGMTWSGIVTYDDIRCVDFLSSLPVVDSNRIGTAGLSMGGRRAWMLSASTDKIKAAASICWMCTTRALMVYGNNETRGQNSHSMIVPGMANYLDIPHMATIACPKPALFFNGLYDDIFPVEGVKDSYAIMREVWKSQDAEDKLVTKIFDIPHLYNREMQKETLDFLDKYLKK